MAFLKDDAIFSDTFNSRRKAVDELAKRYKQRAIPVIREIIDACSTLKGQEDNDVFIRYCQMFIEELLESSKTASRRNNNSNSKSTDWFNIR